MLVCSEDGWQMSYRSFWLVSSTESQGVLSADLGVWDCDWAVKN
jgi:hypothetical protein